MRSAPIHWLTRDGTTTLLRPEPANWASLRFSPVSDRLAMQIHDGTQYDVWVYDWARDTLSRLTFDPGIDVLPAWTPDGRRIVFSSTRSGTYNLYWQRSDGSGEVQRLTQSENLQRASSWHPSGRLLAFQEQRPDTGWDLMTLENQGRLVRAIVQRVEVDEASGEATAELVELGVGVMSDRIVLATDDAERPATRIFTGSIVRGRDRTHLSLAKDSRVPRSVVCRNESEGVAIPQVGGLHHR